MLAANIDGEVRLNTLIVFSVTAPTVWTH